MKVNFPYYHTNLNKLEVDWKIKKLINILKQSNKNFFRVLDVGCSSIPLFVKLNKALLQEKLNYINIDYIGLDYNKSTVEILRRNGIQVYNLDISDLSYKDIKNLGKFDIVWMSHILEHLDVEKQIKALNNISKLSKKETYLFIFAPTPYHWYFWDDFTHVRPMTHGSISDLIQNFGFKVLEAKYSLIRIFPNKLQKWLRLPPLRFFLWEVYVIGVFENHNDF